MDLPRFFLGIDRVITVTRCPGCPEGPWSSALRSDTAENRRFFSEAPNTFGKSGVPSLSLTRLFLGVNPPTPTPPHTPPPTHTPPPSPTLTGRPPLDNKSFFFASATVQFAVFRDQLAWFSVSRRSSSSALSIHRQIFCAPSSSLVCSSWLYSGPDFILDFGLVRFRAEIAPPSQPRHTSPPYSVEGLSCLSGLFRLTNSFPFLN